MDFATKLRKEIFDPFYDACVWDADAKQWLPQKLETRLLTNEKYWKQVLQDEYPAECVLESVSARFFEDEPTRTARTSFGWTSSSVLLMAGGFATTQKRSSFGLMSDCQVRPCKLATTARPNFRSSVIVDIEWCCFHGSVVQPAAHSAILSCVVSSAQTKITVQQMRWYGIQLVALR